MKIAAALVRVSSQQQETESQISSLKSIANEQGYIIPDEFVFAENITGLDKYSEDRQSIKDLKNALKNNSNIEAIFVWELTRLSREPAVLTNMLNEFTYVLKIPIYINDMELWTINIKTKKPIKENIAQLYGAANYGLIELEKIKKRTQRGRNAKAEKGFFVGMLSDGYKAKVINNEKHIVIDEERAEIIKSIFDMYINLNYSQIKIAQYLNSNNIPSFNAREAIEKEGKKTFSQTYKIRNSRVEKLKREGKWLSGTIAQILKNEWYIGKRKYRSVEYNHPAIIDVETFNKVQEKTKAKRFIFSSATNYYAVGGLLFCGKCGNKLFGHSPRLQPHYYCSSIDMGNKCGLEGIGKYLLDGIVWHTTLNLAIKTAEENPLIEYFKLKEGDLNNLNKVIEDNESLLEYDLKEIKVLENDLKGLLKEKIKTKNKNTLKLITEEIRDIENKIETINNNSQKYADEIIVNKEKIKQNENLTNINCNTVFDKVMSLENKDVIKEIIQIVVKKITLFNSERYNKIIRIEYIKGDVVEIITNYRLLPKYFINLSIARMRYDEKKDIIINPDKVIYYSKTKLGNQSAVMLGYDDDNLAIYEKVGITFEILEGEELQVEDVRVALLGVAIPVQRIEPERTDEQWLKWKEIQKKRQKKWKERKKQ